MHNEKAECLTSIYKSGFLRDKLPKRINIYKGIYFILFFFGCEFISYLLNHLFHILTKIIIIIIIIIINIYNWYYFNNVWAIFLF